MSEQQCEAKVWLPGYWHKTQCSRRARVTVAGKALCTQHAKLAKRGRRVQ